MCLTQPVILSSTSNFFPYYCHNDFAITMSSNRKSKICFKFTFSTSANTLIDLSGYTGILQRVQKITSVGTCTWLISIYVVYFDPSCLFRFKKLVSVGTNRSNLEFTVVIWHSFFGLITILSKKSTTHLYLTLFFKMVNA